MRVPVKLLGFVFCLFFFNCGQCQECKRANITQKNTEPVAKESYKDGETVRLTCTTGFTGMYRLKCEKGEWKASIERPCAKKKCSHPGDTANGDFSLITGSEFVFGATVLYTCKKGFEMTSRINQRTCRAQGWDNTLPVCEAVMCPAIHTDGGVTASGNTEEGSYGDVIHFECVSIDKKIDGSSDIHCTETGKWSDSVPKCKEITCAEPAISNGYVIEKMQEYRKDAILKYRCSPGFKPREGIPKCAKFGWTLNPECDEVTCELKSTTFGVKKIKPEGKTIFRAGERVEITCTDKHWFYGTKENIQSFTCGENGKWDSDPVCVEIRCEVPRHQHVYDSYYYSYFSGDLRLGVKKSYACVSGYDKMSSEATCTRDGWIPKPLCAVTCAAPNIPNAEIVGDRRTKYIINSRIQYKCRPGFEPEQPVEITCISRDKWTGIRQCTAAKQKSCRDLSVENGLIHSYSFNEEEIFYTCNTGYKPFTGNWWDSATCSKGSWTEEPRCIREEECGAFPSVHHGKLKQHRRDRATAEVECDPGFISTPRFITCIRGSWEKAVCEVGVRCDIPPKVENALILSKPEEYYVDGSSVTYECRRSFLMNGKSRVSCRNGTWEEMGTCKEKTCKLNSTTFGEKKIKPENTTIFRVGEYVEITCTEKDRLNGTNDIIKSFTCGENGQWDYEPSCAEIRCEVPRDQHVSNLYYFKGDEKLGAKKSYDCSYGYYQMETEATCTRDGWTPKPLCVEMRCAVPRDPHVSDPNYYFSGDLKLGTQRSYYCISGYYQMSSVATCTQDGWTPNPLCEIRCAVPRGQNVYDLYYFSGDLKLGTQRSYDCISGYNKMAEVATCTRDGWTPNPLCIHGGWY